MSPTPAKSIVLLDDEKSYAELMAHMLEENLDCEVTLFTHPFDALRELRARQPQVVVTDYFMPQLDGLQFIARAAPLVPDAAFVLISGHNLHSAEDEIRRLPSVKGVLAKPFGWRQLADEIIRVWPRRDCVPSHRADATSV